MPRADERVKDLHTVRAKRWRLLQSGRGTARWNMGVDEALMEEMVPGKLPVLRFYTWERPTISLGYFQKKADELDSAALQALGGESVHRPTGGRAVLHDDELTYAVVIREEDLPGNVIETYRVLSQALVHGLRILGVPAEVAHDTRPTRRSASAACFDAPSWYEVIAGGRKLIGSAQVRRNGVILQHGSIPITFDVERLLSCLRFSRPDLRARTARILAVKAGALCDFLGERPTEATIVKALREGFAMTHNIEFDSDQLTPSEQQRATELAKTKYGQEELV